MDAGDRLLSLATPRESSVHRKTEVALAEGIPDLLLGDLDLSQVEMYLTFM